MIFTELGNRKRGCIYNVSISSACSDTPFSQKSVKVRQDSCPTGHWGFRCPVGNWERQALFVALKSPDEAYWVLHLQLAEVIQQQVKNILLNISRYSCHPYNKYFLSQDKFLCPPYSQPESKSVYFRWALEWIRRFMSRSVVPASGEATSITAVEGAAEGCYNFSHPILIHCHMSARASWHFALWLLLIFNEDGNFKKLYIHFYKKITPGIYTTDCTSQFLMHTGLPHQVTNVTFTSTDWFAKFQTAKTLRFLLFLWFQGCHLEYNLKAHKVS